MTTALNKSTFLVKGLHVLDRNCIQSGSKTGFEGS